MKKIEQRCGTCKHFDAQLNKAGRRMAGKNEFRRCLVEIPMPIFPYSLTKAYGFRWPLQSSYVGGHSGQTCPLWESL